MRLYQCSVIAALSSVALALFDCGPVVNGIKWDLKELQGPYSVSRIEDSPPTITNTTWTINPCGPIRKSKEEDPKKQCPSGTQVCGIERVTDDSGTKIHKIIPISGDIHGKHGDVTPTRLKASDSHADSEKEGVRVVLTGGSYEGRSQKAVVEFICDPNKTGLEGLKKEEEGKEKRKREEKKEEGDDKEPERKDPKEGESPEEQSLKLISYGTSDAGEDVLRLEWRTKYACESLEKDPGADQGNHWGFFTWFIIILFLGVAAYLIFGSWLNHNRYGARGWDLLPHSDTIRDLPYLLKDWARRVLGTLQGRGGGRSGYSAV
ncbi:autophagy-related protein 27 [Tuber borchii]|uniref:Autophagy-related protein 27 n=1 Tax=Tuber borchii TaxID=42251 RepID=A0A2T7A7D4_TUBBO|nr:autophagy-related protein 27 [Tuber borchii]